MPKLMQIQLQCKYGTCSTTMFMSFHDRKLARKTISGQVCVHEDTTCSMQKDSPNPIPYIVAG